MACKPFCRAAKKTQPCEHHHLRAHHQTRTPPPPGAWQVYELKKDEVDAGVATARRTLDDQYGKISAQANELVTRFTPRKSAPPKDE